jgi:hypothetical protein
MAKRCKWLILVLTLLITHTTHSQGESGGDCTTCCDGIDNDGDGFIDWDDFDCNQSGNPSDDCPYCLTESSCDNGVDDDGDGLIDSFDDDCGPTTNPFLCDSPIWFEDFESYSDGTQNTTKWTTTANNCDADGTPGSSDGNYWGIDQGEFRVNDIEGLDCCGTQGESNNEFITEIIDISTYAEISVSITARVEGNVECAACGSGGDLFSAQWEVDNGGWNNFYTICGATDGFIELNCADITLGNQLQIRILVGNQANDENYYFDDIYVCPDNCTTVLVNKEYKLYGKDRGLYNELTFKRSDSDNIEYLERSTDMRDWVMVSNMVEGYHKTVKDYDFNQNSKNYYRFGDKVIVINNNDTGNFEYFDVLGRTTNKDSDGLKIRLNLDNGEKEIFR